MPETLGEAWRLGWKCTAHCRWYGPQKRSYRMKAWCNSTFALDMLTLVLTRGERFPLARMAEVMRCPKCEEMKIRVMFEPPDNPKPQAMAINDRRRND